MRCACAERGDTRRVRVRGEGARDASVVLLSCVHSTVNSYSEWSEQRVNVRSLITVIANSVISLQACNLTVSEMDLQGIYTL